MVDLEGHKFSCKLTRVSLIPDSTYLRPLLLSRLHIYHLKIINELTVRYAQNCTPLKISTYPTHPDYYSLVHVIKIQRIGPFSFDFLRPVLLAEAECIHK